MDDTRNKKYIISASVPSCPMCSGAVRKIFIPSGIYYKCDACQLSFTVTEPGQAENEMVCEEVKYERTGRT